jgi:hypothetical protein
MSIEIAATTCRSGAFMPVERASAYLLAQGMGDTLLTDVAARTALDVVCRSFGNMQAGPHVDDDRAKLGALTALCAGTMVADHLLHKAEEPTGTSFVGAVPRGNTLVLVRAGFAHMHRLGRRGLTELGDPAPSEALGLGPKVTRYPFTATWERGDVLLLSCGPFMSAMEPKVIARAVLEAESLAAAAQQLVARSTAAASLALVRWVRS